MRTLPNSPNPSRREPNSPQWVPWKHLSSLRPYGAGNLCPTLLGATALILSEMKECLLARPRASGATRRPSMGQQALRKHLVARQAPNKPVPSPRRPLMEVSRSVYSQSAGGMGSLLLGLLRSSSQACLTPNCISPKGLCGWLIGQQNAPFQDFFYLDIGVAWTPLGACFMFKKQLK